MSTPPRDLADAHTRLDTTEAALAGLVHENNELRAIIRRVREHAQFLHRLAGEYQREYAEHQHADDGYVGHLHAEAAVALERIIGDKP